MKVAWILGWAIPPGWFEPLARGRFPQAEHRLIPAQADAMAQLERHGPVDLVIGYSLGAQLLLAEPDRISSAVGLLAPIFAFPQERGLGGRVTLTQVRYLTRWLKRDPAAALQDFYQRAGLDVPVELSPVQEIDALVWGLDRLMNYEAPAKLPAAWTAVCGANDALLDAGRLHAIEPRIQVIPGASHHPATLLPALVQLLQPATTNAHSARC